MQHETIPASIEHLDFEHSVICESLYCQQIDRGSHEADWFVKLSCGNGLAWCNFRFLHYTKRDIPLGGVTCRGHCSGRPDVQVVSWFPVRV